jgi:serine protease
MTQNPLDIPEDVPGQLGLKVQHALRAFTPKDWKTIKAVAGSFVANPAALDDAVVSDEQPWSLTCGRRAILLAIAPGATDDDGKRFMGRRVLKNGMDTAPAWDRQTVMGLLLCLMVTACGAGGGGSGIASNNIGSAGFTVSGTVAGPSNAAVDWDVNDTNVSSRTGSNNSLEGPQPLSNPVRVAGHVKLAGDVSDFYTITLSAGQRISLYIADPVNADLDLVLYDDRGEIKDSAMGDGAVEIMQIAADSDYLVEVRIVTVGNRVPVLDQASNYNLVFSTISSPAAASSGMRLSDEFVPGEVLVQFIDGGFSPASSLAAARADRTRSLGMNKAGGGAGGLMRMQFDPRNATPMVSNLLGLSDGALQKTAAIADEVQKGKQRTLEFIKALRQREDVLIAQPNYLRRIFITPDDPLFDLQWHYAQIHLPQAWDSTTGRSDVIVAVVDSGVLSGHPDLAGKLTDSGYDFISDVSLSGDGDGIDSNPDDPGDQARDDSRSTYHGTYVAGIIAAATDNGTGVAGAGWMTRVMVIRSMGLEGLGTDYDIAQGIRYAAGLPNDSGVVPENPADIINLSLGSDIDSVVLSSAVQDARGQGVIIIAAAGNGATDQPFYPAAYDETVSVSAVDYAANLAVYSSYGSTIDVAAPGGDMTADLNSDDRGDGVLSTEGDDGSGTVNMIYGFSQGTSVAAPHVSAVVSLMKAVQPQLTPDALDGLLTSGRITNDIGDSNYFGAGLIDAHKAVLAVQSGAVPTLLNLNPTLASLGIALSGATITAGKAGDTNGELTVTDVSVDAPWLSIAPETVDANGLGAYYLTAYRNGLADGVYDGTVTFISSENRATVSVTMQVSTVRSSAGAGYHYVHLVHADTGAIAYQTGAGEVDGLYHYLFTDVSQGDYFVYAGTDLDKDFDVRDAGEITGAYRNLSQPQRITVNSNMEGVDFFSQFNLQSDVQNP